MSVDRSTVRIVGAGPTGALLAILLQRQRPCGGAV